MSAPKVLPIRKPNPGITAEIVAVTPTMAREWLGQNTKNRPLKSRAIVAYTRDMAAGNWRLTGEAIKFDATGRMLDGQNRCHALIQADVTVNMLVIRNLDPNTQDVMDAGVRRTNADQLNLRGVPNSVTVATIAAAWTGYMNGVWKTAGTQQGAPVLTHSETLKFVDDHPEVLDAARIAKRVVKVLRLAAGPVGASWMIFAEIDDANANTFFDKISDMETSGYGDPIATLLKTVQQDRELKRLMRPAESFYLIIRSWNAWRKGERLTVLRTGVPRSKKDERYGGKAARPFDLPTPR